MTLHKANRRLASAAFAVLMRCSALAASVDAHVSTGTTCETTTIGVDSTFAGNSAGSYLGRSVGQTFLATDTLISSLKVWRVASQTPNWFIGMHLFITETDSAGYPRLDRILLDGTTLVIPSGDGVHPIPFQWRFDPPLRLPGPGTYAFFLALDPCLAYFDVLATSEDAGLYPEGVGWTSGRSAGCLLERSGYADAFPRADLIFLIEFCRGVTTPVRRSTWGGLKIIYR